MNQDGIKFFLNENIQIDLNNFLLSLITAALLSILIQLVYNRFSSTLSNKIEFSKNFVILGITTAIVITIVKSSLALSLGLVGALSIVRFRAAIKEPEELTYLFLIIATGLGTGAGQIKMTVIGILFSLIVIIIYSYFFKQNKIKLMESINLGILIDQKVSLKEINDLLEEMKKTCDELTFVSMSQTKKHTNINLDLRTKNFKDIAKLSNTLNNKFRNIKVIFTQHNNILL
jgi:hypothetical protein